MNSKRNQNKLIQRLLQIGKKHKVLVYPTLALVAVISAFSYFYRWAASSGKRVVAAVLVGVLVISQSYFMTSSANESDLVEEEEQLIDISAMDDGDGEQEDLVDSAEADASGDEMQEDSPVGSSTSADYEDPEDYRETSVDSDAEPEGSSGDQNTSAGDESEGSVNKDTYSTSGQGRITAVSFIDPDQQTNMLFPIPDTTEFAIKAALPEKLRCTVVSATGTVTYPDLKVDWTGDKAYVSTMNAYTIEYSPSIRNASEYSSISDDIKNLTITVELYKYYKIEFKYQGALTGGDFPNDTSKGTFGYIGMKYTLPNVSRSKADGSGDFKLTGWYIGDDKQGTAGDDYIINAESYAGQTITLTAKYYEAEVTYVDERNQTRYDYPEKGTQYQVPASLTPATVLGYKFNGWISKDNGLINDDNPIVSNSIDDTTLTASWSPLQYRISYNANYGAGSGYGAMSSEVHTYDTANDALTDCGYTRYGYRFAGWSTNANASADDTDLYGQNEALTKEMIDPLYMANGNMDMPELTLYAVWEEVQITYDDNTTEKSIHSTYGEAVNESFGLSNGNTSSGNFAVALKGATLAGQACTPDAYIENFSLSTNGTQMSVSGTPKTVWSGDMILTLTVSDTGAGTSNDLTLTISTQKKELTIASVTVPNKVYDGTNVLTEEGRAGLQITLDGIYGSDDVSVKQDSLSVYYDSKTAGDKTLIFSQLELSGSMSGNYTIASACNVENAAKITKRPLHITLEGKIYKYAGEKAADPSSQDFQTNFAENETEATKALVLADGGLSSEQVLTLTYTVPNVDEQREYDIDVVPRSTNYDVTCDATCKLVVTQDVAAEKKEGVDGNYSISGTYNEETGWYTDVVTIQPEIQHGADYYNQILRVGSQEWVSSIEIDDDSELNEQEIQVAMRNGRTGAYTTDSEKMTFKVDSKAPEYTGATFAPASSTSVLENIGYFFSYGNFFKETVSATLSFTDNKSGCDKIYYSIKGSEDEDEWDSRSLKEDSVTLTIPLGTNNEIYFYVTDKAGNKSPVTKLLGNADGSEWVIENSDPVITGYHIANMEGDRISNLSSGGWYNQEVQVIAEVNESQSGIHYADWYINGDVDRVTEDSLVRSDEDTSVSIAYPFTRSGIYEVGLDVSDNAKNSSGKTDLTTVRIDLEGPDIHLDETAIPDSWSQSVDVNFTVTDDVSGIYKVSVVPPTGTSYELYPNEDDTYTLTATMEGEYTIVARDEANNESSKTITFDNISKEIPKNATVTWSPENPNGNNDWYTVKTAAIITPAAHAGKVPVTTYYKLWKGEAEPAEAVAVTQAVTVPVPEDGVWTLRVWTETAAGVKSEGEYVRTVHVDTTIPDAMITQVKAETSYQTVNFTVSDATSGISVDQIKVVNGKTTVASQITPLSDGSGYQGTFTVASAGNYVVQVADLAGNVSESAMYAPMTLKVNAIKDITESTATISSVTKRGTYAIANVKYEYKKAGDSNYTEITPYAVRDAQGNVTASYSFQSLKANTKYYYRITTVSAIGEALNYTGSFKTAGVNGIGITGKVVDADNAAATITVSLLEGNTVLKTTEIQSGNSFVFNRVADGNYNITATNGMTTKTISVNIYKGKVIDPAGDILITLRNGMNTSISITGSKTPNVSVSGLEDIFMYDTVNFTDADKKFIAEGGSVEFKLYVASKSSGSISQSALSAIYRMMSDNEKVNMFLDLSLTKVRTYASGAVESRTAVTELAGGVSLKIVVPMSSKVIKAPEKSVIRVHGNKASLLADLDASASSYTIETNKFSTYALTYKAANDDKTTEEDNKTTEDEPNSNNGDKTGDGKSIKDYDASPKTGDGSPLAALMGLMCISLAGVVVLRKKEIK